MDHSAVEDKLQRKVNDLVSQNKDVFNAVLGVARAKGDFSWSGAAGTAYAKNREKMKADTPFFIASITKMYTAAVTIIFEEQGRPFRFMLKVIKMINKERN